MPTEFAVVDLASQACAVAAYVSGRLKPRFLAWLTEYGDVIRTERGEQVEEYAFQSRCGVWAGFWFKPSGDLVLPVRVGRSGQGRVVVPMAP